MQCNKNMNAVARMMQSGVNGKVFPGAVLLVSYKDEILFYDSFGLADIESGQLMQKNSVFDLASLTKPLAAALCLMRLVEKSAISLDNNLSQIFTDIFRPENGTFWADNINNIKDKADITVEQLLRHISGLPAHRPFYEQVVLKPKAERRNFMRQLVLTEPLAAKPGQRQIYSDLGYMLLAWIIEQVSVTRLDKFVYKEIYEPIGVKELFFMPIGDNIDNIVDNRNIAIKNYSDKSYSNQINKIDSKKDILFVPTEICPWRKKVLRAEVHDDNAWAVGGVDGHAGLFGTALGVWCLLIEIMNILNGQESLLVKKDTLKRFLSKNYIYANALAAGRFDMVAGFDTPSLSGSSAGRYFSSESIGHLGFTGTSFWLDPLNSVIVILLSNRVHPTRNNQKIKEFRPMIHDLIIETLIR
ncbi:MAG: serine hydrolase domain-containing protein [Desulfamplus sp.]